MAIESLGVGSNLDLTSLLSSLKKSEQAKLEPITTKITSTNAKLSGFGQLQSSLEGFQKATQKLNSAELYEGFATEVSGSALTATAGSTAAAGSYDIKINSLATAHSLAALGQADTTSTIATGTLNIDVGGKSTPVTITDGSLAGIRDAINKSDAGVKASIVNDGDDKAPYRLVLTSETTGEDSKITFPEIIDSGFETLFSGVNPTPTVKGQDANLTVNGLPITSASNTVEEAIQGVTLNLTETTADGASTKLTVSQDTDTVKTAVQDFVKAYNSLADKITSLTKVDGEGDKVKGAALTGNSTVRSVQSSLRNVMSSAVAGDDMNYLFEAGISFNKDGKLEIDDEKKLDDALANNLDGLKGLFAGDGKTGIAPVLDNSITQMLKDNGAVGSAKAGLESSVKSLEARSLRMQDTIETTVERYKKQFQQLDVMMSKLNNTQSYLSQQFEALNSSSKN